MIKKNVIGNKFFFNISEQEGVDVDNAIDFNIAEYLFKRNKK